VSGVNPKFSPDGALITYQNNGIKVMNSDGTYSRLLNATGGLPSFNPAGTMIAYDDNGIWKINVDGTGRTQLTSDAGYWPVWSPDGAQIAFGAAVGSSKHSTISQVFIMNADGTNRHQVPTNGSVIDVVWQPSAKLLFGMSVSSGSYDLYSYDPANSSSLTRLTTSSYADDEPSWSPDGTKISWTSGTNRTGGIWAMNADGSGKQGPVIPKGRQGSWGR
jgi:Periplasmic component of the Tol biopolymer transport system